MDTFTAIMVGILLASTTGIPIAAYADNRIRKAKNTITALECYLEDAVRLACMHCPDTDSCGRCRFSLKGFASFRNNLEI